MKKAAVIGNPVTLSLSPVIFNYWFEALGIDATYETLKLEENDLDGLLGRLRSGEFIGCNVTIPFKEKIFRKMDVLDNAAKGTGAVNMVFTRNGKRLEGRNTDCTGFLENLVHHAPDWGKEVSTALVLGAGGAARAVVFALLQKGKNVLVAGRDQHKLNAFATFFESNRIQTLSWDEKEKMLSRVGMIVNTTPLGMVGNGDVELDFSAAPKAAFAYDLVYAPGETGFLRHAQAAGLKTIGGLGMLVHQAVPAFEAWFKEQPPVDENLYAILESELKNRGWV